MSFPDAVTGGDLINGVPGAAALLDEQGRIAAVNEDWRDFFVDNGGEQGLSWVGVDYLAATGANTRATAAVSSVVERTAPAAEVVYACPVDGVPRWFRMVARAAGSHTLVTHVDVTTERRRALEVMENSPVGYLELDEDLRADVVPSSWCRDTGQTADKAHGRGWLDVVAESERPRVLATLRACVRRGDTVSVDARSSATSSKTWVRFVASPVSGGLVLSVIDITADRRRTARLQHAATHDRLTGLATRRLLEERMAKVIRSFATSRRRAGAAGLLFLDLDDFKVVNDAHGHAAGDLVIRVVGSRIAAGLRDGDLPARLGGDEFVVLVDRVTDEDSMVDIASRICDRVAEPLQLDDGTILRPSVSVGAVLIDGRQDPDDVLEAADRAMYAAKAEGGGQVRVAASV